MDFAASLASLAQLSVAPSASLEGMIRWVDQGILAVASHSVRVRHRFPRCRRLQVVRWKVVAQKTEEVRIESAFRKGVLIVRVEGSNFAGHLMEVVRIVAAVVVLLLLSDNANISISWYGIPWAPGGARISVVSALRPYVDLLTTYEGNIGPTYLQQALEEVYKRHSVIATNALDSNYPFNFWTDEAVLLLLDEGCARGKGVVDAGVMVNL